jgi:cellulose synthase/poly-beta-1,6-N-acetylglucosamine synthase-like glycosyltransferase
MAKIVRRKVVKRKKESGVGKESWKKKAERIKVSVVIPVYKPEQEVFDRVRKALDSQTIKAEIIENWNMPEVESLNNGIRKARGDIIILMQQDSVPVGERWLEKLIEPLKDGKVVASVSDLWITERYWKKRPFLIRLLTINDRIIRKPQMDARGCAYRKKDLIDVGLFSENPSIIAGDADLHFRLRKKGRLVRAGTLVFHEHPFYNLRKTIRTLYIYSRANGIVVRDYGFNSTSFWKRIIRAVPILGFASSLYRYPFKRHPFYLPLFIIFAMPVINFLNVLGFWIGFFKIGKKASYAELMGGVKSKIKKID